MSGNRPPSDRRPQPKAAPSTPPPPIPSETLFAPGQREALIQHGAEQYRLRQTRNGKLILTK